jgi:hypothetical protein
MNLFLYSPTPVSIRNAQYFMGGPGPTIFKFDMAAEGFCTILMVLWQTLHPHRPAERLKNKGRRFSESSIS